MTTLTPADLLLRLRALPRGGRLISLWTETSARCRKRTQEGAPCPYPALVKRSHVQAVINFAWANTVHAQLLREAGDAADSPEAVERIVAAWSPVPRPWGSRLTDTPLVEHNGKYYLECLVTRVLSAGLFTADDLAVTRQEAAPWLEARAWDGPTEKELFLRDYALASIRAIRMGGETWTVTPAAEGPEPPAGGLPAHRA